MKKMIRISAAYLIFGLAAGLFYREATVYTGYTGHSVLALVHGHALSLGALVFLLAPVFMQVFHLQQHKAFHRFVCIYNIGLVLSLVCMTARGVVQLFELPISKFIDHMIGGFAGIGHMILTVGLYFLFRSLWAAVKE